MEPRPQFQWTKGYGSLEFDQHQVRLGFALSYRVQVGSYLWPPEPLKACRVTFWTPLDQGSTGIPTNPPWWEKAYHASNTEKCKVAIESYLRKINPIITCILQMMTNERETKQTSSSSFPIFKLLLMCLLVVVDLTTWTYPASVWGIKMSHFLATWI